MQWTVPVIVGVGFVSTVALAQTGPTSRPALPESRVYRHPPLVDTIYTADPSAHVFDGRLYVYCSHDA